jgi:uncharacterized protein YbaA (DUF1428 family)
MEDVRYVDIYLLPVPEARLDEYREQAALFGAVAREHGALSYREFRGDDLDERLGADLAAGTVLTSAFAEFRSRAHRDEVMAKVLEDPRVSAMMEGEALADMSRMRYGGFELLVSA